MPRNVKTLRVNFNTLKDTKILISTPIEIQRTYNGRFESWNGKALYNYKMHYSLILITYKTFCCWHHIPLTYHPCYLIYLVLHNHNNIHVEWQCLLVQTLQNLFYRQIAVHLWTFLCLFQLVYPEKVDAVVLFSKRS